MVTGRKYYDDCAQILSEHLIAKLRPSSRVRFSTLCPLLHTHPTESGEDATEDQQPGLVLQRAFRMLQGQMSGVTDDEESAAGDANAFRVSVVEAATLDEGARPVRELPNNLTSEPASIAPSANSSIAEDGLEATTATGMTRSGSMGNFMQQEELRCVLAIIRHGDRTPKQKLKLEMKEKHILDYFHRQ